LLDVGTAITVGRVVKVGDFIELKLTRPVCAEEASRVAISRKIAERWRLIGYGIIR
ncbi:TPA: translation initiation factor IF-2 subunit gamma, partial [Candidatus Bathyarchaeota archaeon]|nr:translation initiation factor IF-2 subunit gamma [Candidatus Bathyarchaeota archaeon]